MLTGRRRPWRPQLTRAELGRGWVFFALYVFLFPWLMGWVQRSYQGEFPVAEANVVYYLIIAALTFLVLWSYLKHGFRLLLDWLPENLFAFAQACTLAAQTKRLGTTCLLKFWTILLTKPLLALQRKLL